MSGELSATSVERPAPPAPIVDPAAEASPAQARARRDAKSWREQRWERRRRRRWAEEILAWFLVPAILICGFWAIKAALTALGTSPTALYEQIKSVAGSRP